MKALVTGSLGFVGHYLRGELEQNGYEVTGIDVREAENTICCDLLDMEQTEKAITQVQPDILIHSRRALSVVRVQRSVPNGLHV